MAQINLDLSPLKKALEANLNTVTFTNDGSGTFTVSKDGRKFGTGAYAVNSTQSQVSRGLR